MAAEDRRLQGARPVVDVDGVRRPRRHRRHRLLRRGAGLPGGEGRLELRPDLREGRVAHDDQRGVARLEPRLVPAHDVVARDLLDARRVAGAGQRDRVRVARPVDEARQNAERHAERLRALLLDGRELLPLQTIQLLLREGGVEDHVGEDRERRVEVRLEGRERDGRRVEVGARAELGPEPLQLVADLERGARLRALVEHVAGEAGGAGRGLVGRVAGVDEQVHPDDRHLVPLGHDELQAVRQGGALEGGKAALRRRSRRRARLAVGPARARGELRERVHLERVDAVRQPASRGGRELGRRRGLHALELRAVEVGPAAPDLALREDVRLAAEAADPLHAAHEAGELLRLRALHLLGRRPVLQQARDLLVDRLLDRGEVAARPRGGAHDERAADLRRSLVRRDVGRDLVRVDEPLVQPRALARRQHPRDEPQRVVLRRAPLRRVPHFVDPRLRHPVLQRLAVLARAGGDPRVVLRDRRARRDVAEVLLDPRLHVLGLHVAGHDEDGVLRAVVGLEPLLHVVERGGVEVLHRADDRPRVRVALRVDRGLDELLDLAVGLVLTLPLLVLDDPALLVELRLGDRADEMSHAVRLHPQDGVEGAHRHVLEVVGAVLVRRAVEVGRADLLEDLEVVVVEVLGAVEHQVLEEVGEAGLARLLVLRADVVPDVHRRDRGLVVLVDDEGEAVRQHVLLEGDLRDSDLGGGQQGRAQQGDRRGEKEFRPHGHLVGWRVFLFRRRPF